MKNTTQVLFNDPMTRWPDDSIKEVLGYACHISLDNATPL